MSLVPDKGLRIERRFTRAGTDVYSAFEFEKRKIDIRAATGDSVKEQIVVEVPVGWSATAVEILAQKYFRKTGVPQADGSFGGETSVRQVVHRMALAWRSWGARYGYFRSAEAAEAFYDESVYMLLSQMAAPNSPQWFNTGLFEAYGIAGPPQGHWYVDPNSGEVHSATSAYEHPQPHACFILSVKDDLVNPGGIMDLILREARLFKYGSGSGTNYSALRSDREKLSGGGFSSGVLSFLKVGDAAAGAVRSGGTTRRAAKMVQLDIDHPEIRQFIRWKAAEEEKAAVLVNAGYSATMEGEAYRTVSGQYSNNSVRITDEFMNALRNNTTWSLIARTSGEVIEEVNARLLWDEIADAAWSCGDPGVQFDTVINNWNTCAADGRIRASNPCAEYMFLDDTACNLASLNLARFVNALTGNFDIESFVHACRIWSIVLDVSVQAAQYPSPEVALRSFSYRTLGVGFTNLGAVIMRNGWAYDSDPARKFAAAVAALLTGAAYRTSAEMAQFLGPFSRYEANKIDMLRIIGLHQYHVRKEVQSAINSGENRTKAVTPIATIIKKAEDVWDEVMAAGIIHGFRNAQVSVIAPTGTIGLLMDCDTTGIEPEYALLKIKKMVEGATRQLYNRQVVSALRVLNYTPDQIDAFITLLLNEGAQKAVGSLHEKDSAVFACSSDGGIAVAGHLQMMAAVQPFISGAISKTVNFPNTASRQEVASCFLLAWQLGLKSITVYRNGSKLSQPLLESSKHQAVENQEGVFNCQECG